MSSLSQIIKQRVIGALILISGCIIFIPMLLDGRQELTTNIGEDLPEAPAMLYMKTIQGKVVENFVIDQESQKDYAQVWTQEPVIEDEIPVSVLPDKSDNAEADGELEVVELATKPGLDEAGQLKAWSVQVGSFLQDKRADELKDKLRERGFKAYTQNVMRKNVKSTRVLVGPRLQWEKVMGLRKNLKDKMGLEGVIVRYKP